MRLIWTASAVAKHERGGYDPRHTISNVTDEAVDPFIRQMRPGCPWLLISDDGETLRAGVGPESAFVSV